MDSLKVMILGVSKYQFKDSESGRDVAGCTVHYVQLTHADEDDKIGFFPAKASLSLDKYNQFRGLTFPLLADATITLNLSNNRNPIKVTGFSITDNVVI